MKFDASSAKEKDNTIFTYVLKLSGTEIGSPSEFLRIVIFSGIIVAVLACLILLRQSWSIKKIKRKIDYDKLGEDSSAPAPEKRIFSQFRKI